MRRILLAGLLAIAVMAAAPPARAADARPDLVAVEDLLAEPERFAGEVTVRGELVGDYGYRNDGCVWTQLNDDPYARTPILEGGALSGSNVGVGLCMSHAMADDLAPPGGYRQHGPLVEVTAIWRYHDPDRGGESYLEARSLTVLEPGRALREDPHWVVLGAGVALLAAAGLLWLTRRRDD